MFRTRSVWVIAITTAALISGCLWQRPQTPGGGLHVSTLPQASCPHTQHLRVCSHRADARELHAGVGTMHAVERLWAAGIDCFDLDILVTADSVLMVGHPEWLQSRLSPPAPADAARQTERYTREQFALWGATEELFPRLESVMEVFSRLLRESGMTYSAHHYMPDLGREPVLLLDFKGAAFLDGPVQKGVAAAVKAGVVQHTMVWVPDSHPASAAVEAAAKRAHSAVPLLRGYPDRALRQDGSAAPPATRIAPHVRENYHAVGPSIKVPDSLFLDAREAHLPLFSWVADDNEMLQRVLQVKSDAVISNTPLAIKRLLQAWRERCQQT